MVQVGPLPGVVGSHLGVATDTPKLTRRGKTRPIHGQGSSILMIAHLPIDLRIKIIPFHCRQFYKVIKYFNSYFFFERISFVDNPMISPSMGHRQYGTDSEDEYGAPNLQQGPEF